MNRSESGGISPQTPSGWSNHLSGFEVAEQLALRNDIVGTLDVPHPSVKWPNKEHMYPPMICTSDNSTLVVLKSVDIQLSAFQSTGAVAGHWTGMAMRAGYLFADEFKLLLIDII
jgi:hypothetical protein